MDMMQLIKLFAHENQKKLTFSHHFVITLQFSFGSSFGIPFRPTFDPSYGPYVQKYALLNLTAANYALNFLGCKPALLNLHFIVHHGLKQSSANCIILKTPTLLSEINETFYKHSESKNSSNLPPNQKYGVSSSHQRKND